MNTSTFDESKVRREQGRFAVKPHSEAEIDLGAPEEEQPLLPMDPDLARLDGVYQRWSAANQDDLYRLGQEVHETEDLGEYRELAAKYGLPEQAAWDFASADPDKVTLPANSWPSHVSEHAKETLSMVEQTGWRYNYASENDDGTVVIMDSPKRYLVERSDEGILMRQTGDHPRDEFGPDVKRFSTVEDLRDYVNAEKAAAVDGTVAWRVNGALAFSDPGKQGEVSYAYDADGGEYTYTDPRGDVVCRIRPNEVGPDAPEVRQLAAATPGVKPDIVHQALVRGTRQAAHANDLQGQRFLDRAAVTGRVGSSIQADDTRRELESRLGEAHVNVNPGFSLASAPRATAMKSIGSDYIGIAVDHEGNEVGVYNTAIITPGELDANLAKRPKARSFIAAARSRRDELKDLAQATYNSVV